MKMGKTFNFVFQTLVSRHQLVFTFIGTNFVYNKFNLVDSLQKVKDFRTIFLYELNSASASSF